MDINFFRFDFRARGRVMMGLAAATALLSAGMLLGGCSAEEPAEPEGPGAVPGEPGEVRFSVIDGEAWGSGDGTNTRTEALAKSDGEKTINKLYAVIFSDTNGNKSFDESADKYLKTVEATYDATNKYYKFTTPKKGTYHAYFVTNVASSFFSGLTAGTSTAANLKSLVYTLDADDSKRGSSDVKGHVMLTPTPRTFTYSLESTPVEVGPITMQHICARIEIVNKSIYKITKVTMTNNVTKSALGTPLNDAGVGTSTATLTLTGSGSNPLLAAEAGAGAPKVIYVYENSGSTKRAQFTVEYTDLKGVTQTIESKNIVGNDGSSLKIERDKRYVLTISGERAQIDYSETAVGDLMYSDGHTSKTAVSGHGDVVGVVACLYGQNGATLKAGVKEALKAKGITTPHGLVLSLDESQQYWDTRYHSNIIGTGYESATACYPNCPDGISFQNMNVGNYGKTVLELAITSVAGVQTGAGFEAFKWCYDRNDPNNTSGVTAVTSDWITSSTTGWYMPSYSEWVDMFLSWLNVADPDSYDTLAGDLRYNGKRSFDRQNTSRYTNWAIHNFINGALGKATGSTGISTTGAYWTATQHTANSKAVYMLFETAQIVLDKEVKYHNVEPDHTRSLLVRAVLAF